MNKRKTFTVMAILIAVLVLGVGYAAISSVTLNLNGTGNVKADAAFSVEYDQTHTVAVDPSSGTVSMGEPAVAYPIVAGAYTGATTATMTVYLDHDHTSGTAIYKIDNKSSALYAKLTPNVIQVGSPNTDYFGTITSGVYSDAECQTALSDNLAPGASAYLKVIVPKGSVEPATDVTGATFSVTITAAPKSTASEA